MHEEDRDPLALLAQALDQASRVIACIQPAQLSLPTPCAEWTVQDIVTHLLVGLRRTRARIDGEDVEETLSTLSLHPAQYAAEAQATLAAWRRPGALDQMYAVRAGT